MPVSAAGGHTFGQNAGVKQRSRQISTNGTTLPLSSSGCESEHVPYESKVKPDSRLQWQRYTHSGTHAEMFWLLILFSMILIVSRNAIILCMEPRTRSITPSRSSDNLGCVFFLTGGSENDISKWNHFPFLSPLATEGRRKPNYGGLVLKLDHVESRPISIRHGDYVTTERERDKFLARIDDSDDDHQPESSKEDTLLPNKCRKVSWANNVLPNCNQAHEIAMGDLGEVQPQFEITYLSSGSYRDAFRFRRMDSLTLNDHIVAKRLLLQRSTDAKSLSKIQKEANILEKLSSSSRILDIFAYCGSTVFVEAMASDLHTQIVPGKGFSSQKSLDRLDDLYPRNNFTASEKLQIALDMAESLADLHGFKGGPIIHADTHIEQWLLAPDGSVKLNDFNNAKEPRWNGYKGSYCVSRGTYGGTYRSPEEFSGKSQNEAVDVFAFGSNIYTLVSETELFHIV